jgi:hypothetical protein
VFLPPIEELEQAFDAMEEFMKNPEKKESRSHVGYG